MTQPTSSSSSSRAGADRPTKLKFIVQSSDVISDMRVNVSEEGSQDVIWYKERFLSDDEIIEHIVHNPSSTICWTIHRPSERGWYIRIRAPSFPPGIFIPFLPVPRTSPHYSDASLTLSSRTSVPPTLESDPNRPSISSIHSYPPTPPAVVVQPYSPKSVETELEETSKSQSPKPGKQATQVTQFILTPHSTQVVQPTSNSFFARALSVLKNNRPSHSNSFTLSRLPANVLSSPPSYSSSPSSTSSTDTSRLSTFPAFLPPLLVFHDRTPMLTVGTFTGLLEIDRAEEQLLGVETSFWIAIALTYLEFLEERESYLAALSD